MPIEDLDQLQHRLGKRGFRLIDALPHQCPACGERAVARYAIAGKAGGRDIELCAACGAARSWQKAPGLEQRVEDAGFDLRAFLA